MRLRDLVAAAGIGALGTVGCGASSGGHTPAPASSVAGQGGSPAGEGSAGASAAGMGDGSAGEAPLDMCEPSSTPGVLDPDFGDAGLATVTVPGAASTGGTNGLVRQKDGKLVVAGNSSGRSLMFRLSPNGALDTSFGTDGFVLNQDAASIALSLALDARDNLLLGGSNGADAWVERHTPSGLLDTTFGEAGRATLDFGGSHEYVTALFAREDGSIVTSAISESTAGQHSVVTFLDESGSLITALGTDGTVELDPGNGNYYASDVVEQPDGTFLVSGRLSMSGVVGGALYFAKLDAQGGLVKSYGEGGFLEVGGSYNETLKMTRDPAGDGVAWATGGSLGLAATTFTLDAFAASGMSTGFALVHASSPSAVLPRAVAVDCARNVLTAGLVLAGGTTGGGVARFSMAGVPDASFGEAGSARWTPIDQNASFSRILPLPSGKVLAAGSATAGFTVAQYLN